MCANLCVLQIYFCSSQGCPKQFPSITSLLVHHSVMPEMLPCPLSLHRYNPSFRPHQQGNDDDEGSTGTPGGNGEGGDYLDPDTDYEVIQRLREGLMLGCD